MNVRNMIYSLIINSALIVSVVLFTINQDELHLLSIKTVSLIFLINTLCSAFSKKLKKLEETINTKEPLETILNNNKLLYSSSLLNPTSSSVINKNWCSLDDKNILNKKRNKNAVDYCESDESSEDSDYDDDESSQEDSDYDDESSREDNDEYVEEEEEEEVEEEVEEEEEEEVEEEEEEEEEVEDSDSDYTDDNDSDSDYVDNDKYSGYKVFRIEYNPNYEEICSNDFSFKDYNSKIVYARQIFHCVKPSSSTTEVKYFLVTKLTRTLKNKLSFYKSPFVSDTVARETLIPLFYKHLFRRNNDCTDTDEFYRQIQNYESSLFPELKYSFIDFQRRPSANNLSQNEDSQPLYENSDSDRKQSDDSTEYVVVK